MKNEEDEAFEDIERRQGGGFPAKRAMAVDKLQEPAQEPKPSAWRSFEATYLHSEALDILMGDGSVLCGVLPQYNGDLWWHGSGIGEKFIDPKYADITHWRIHSNITPPLPVQPVQEPVAWGFRSADGSIYDCISPEAHDECEGSYTVPLYTKPPQEKNG
jgi:hypothetical protein